MAFFWLEFADSGAMRGQEVVWISVDCAREIGQNSGHVGRWQLVPLLPMPTTTGADAMNRILATAATLGLLCLLVGCGGSADPESQEAAANGDGTGNGTKICENGLTLAGDVCVAASPAKGGPPAPTM